MQLHSLNPFSGERFASYTVHSDAEVGAVLKESEKFQRKWNRKSIADRSTVLRLLADLLNRDIEALSILMAMEMGKPLRQGRAEIGKCASCCTWYADQLESMLAPRVVETDAHYSAVRFEAKGIWLAIMPWNFPFWQVIRCLVPATGAGNTLILKHASNVTGCALHLESIVNEAAGGSLLKVLKVPSDRVAEVISHPLITGVSFTGSEAAGRRVAAMAGAHIRPCVLELGGSNAFIVLADAYLEKAARDAVSGRFQNSGQSCIAAKRILVQRSVYDSFIHLFIKEIELLKTGDPLSEETDVGPLAKASFCEQLQDQVDRSVKSGARIELGGSYLGVIYEPTLLSGALVDMPCMQEELFGPVAVVAVFEDLKEAISISNSTRFGLGVSIYTQDVKSLEKHLGAFQEGAVFVNSIVKSDPRLPFGGVKDSGFGRELSIEGILEFTNVKTLYISN